MKLRNILIGMLVVIMLLSAYRIMNTVTKKKVQEDRVYPVVVANPVIGTIQEKISLVGDVKGEAEVTVRPRTVGRVEEIYIKEGDQVRKGQRLMSFVKGIKRSNDLYDDVVTTAPISGVVGMQNYKIGEQIQMVSGSPAAVFTIYKINNIKIYANVPEKYYSFLKRDTKVEVTFDAIPSKVYSGVVNNIRPVIDPNTRTTQVEIVLKNPKQEIRPGMFSKVDLILREKKNAMKLPYDAVLGLKDRSVFVYSDGSAISKKVTIGLQEGEMIEIVSGISAEAQVIVVGQRLVKEGDKVQISK